jgi:predicted DNA-binding ribbon-helix-helix protein
MKKFSVIIAKRHATSISLEEEFYQALTDIAKEENIPLNELITEVDSTRQTANLSSALRLYVLKKLQQKIKAKSE